MALEKTQQTQLENAKNKIRTFGLLTEEQLSDLLMENPKNRTCLRAGMYILPHAEKVFELMTKHSHPDSISTKKLAALIAFNYTLELHGIKTRPLNEPFENLIAPLKTAPVITATQYRYSYSGAEDFNTDYLNWVKELSPFFKEIVLAERIARTQRYLKEGNIRQANTKENKAILIALKDVNPALYNLIPSYITGHHLTGTENAFIKTK